MSVNLITTSGRLPVTVCGLCAALVVAIGQDRHDAVHRAAIDHEHVDDEPLDVGAVRDDDEALDRLGHGGEPTPGDPLEPMLRAWADEAQRPEEEDQMNRRERRARGERGPRKVFPLEITVIHPEHGAYKMHVHCLRSPDGALVLMAFASDTPMAEQGRLILHAAAEFNDAIVQLTEEDIPYDTGIRLAAEFHAHPESRCVLMQVERAG